MKKIDHFFLMMGVLFPVLTLLSAAAALCAEPFPSRIELEPAGTIPHQTNAYCQGLFFERTDDGTGILYESCGRYGKSRIHILDAETGKSLKEVKLPKKIFAEGLTVRKDEVYLLSWREGIGSIRDKKTLKEKKSFRYDTEGWGLTFDGVNFILSDGSDQLVWYSPETLEPIGRLDVYYENNGEKRPVRAINELEWINGEIWTNIYQTPYIARINPKTGQIIQLLDFSFCIPKGYEKDQDRVLNGIAWDEDSGIIYLTGKDWPVIYRFQVPNFSPSDDEKNRGDQ